MTRFDAYLAQINARLSALLPVCDYDAPQVCDAMRYSLEGGGKRIRPVLMLESCRLCGGEPEDALDFACALEMANRRATSPSERRRRCLPATRC